MQRPARVSEIATQARLQRGILNQKRTFNLGFVALVAMFTTLFIPSKPIAQLPQIKPLNAFVEAQTVDKIATPTATPDTRNLAVPVGMPNNIPDTPEAQYIKNSRWNGIIYRQWVLESNRGTTGHAATCRSTTDKNGKPKKKQYNDFGFALPLCFNTFEASVDRLVKWWDDHDYIELDVALCGYNLGFKAPLEKGGGCQYSRDFHNLF